MLGGGEFYGYHYFLFMGARFSLESCLLDGLLFCSLIVILCSISQFYFAGLITILMVNYIFHDITDGYPILFSTFGLCISISGSPLFPLLAWHGFCDGRRNFVCARLCSMHLLSLFLARFFGAHYRTMISPRECHISICLLLLLTPLPLSLHLPFCWIFKQLLQLQQPAVRSFSAVTLAHHIHSHFLVTNSSRAIHHPCS